MDDAKLMGWVERIGWRGEKVDDTTMRLNVDDATLPPFFVRQSEHWLMLAMLPVFGEADPVPSDLPYRLLMLNRDMRLAKFAYGEADEVVLCAELPTESLDFSEFSEAANRMVRYLKHYREYLLGPSRQGG